MNPSQASFSNLTNEQIQQVKNLEVKLNPTGTNRQETILIAYDNPQ